VDEGRQRDKQATCLRIIEAARRLFAEIGYDQVTMRMLAAEADVNIALINRYFGTKHQLFGRVVARQGSFPSVIEGDPEALPERLAEYVAHRFFSEESSPTSVTIARSMASPEVRDLMRDRLRATIVEPLQELLMERGLDADDARLRASSAAAVVIGVAQLRVAFGPMEGPPVDAAVEHLTKVFRTCLS